MKSFFASIHHDKYHDHLKHELCHYDMNKKSIQSNLSEGVDLSFKKKIKK